MTARVWASWEGGQQTATVDKKSTQTVDVFYEGEDDINAASSAISLWLSPTVPDLFAVSGVLELQRFGPVKRIAPGVFSATASYADPEGSGSGGRGGQNNPPALGEFKIDWDISSITQKQTFSKAGKFASYVDPSFNDPNPDGAIGVKKSNNGKMTVEGVDRRFPAMKFSVNMRVPRGLVTGIYTRNLRRYIFHRNDGPWLGWGPKELLFVGSSGSQSVFGDPEIKFEFETDQTEVISGLGSIPDVTKEPHDYLDVVYDTTANDSTKQLISKPIAAYVHEFYPTVNYVALFGFGP